MSGVEEQIVGGRYRLEQVIGQGGMGRVWRAQDLVLRRTVAVKEVTPEGTSRELRLALASRMRREAQLSARFRHRAVITVHGVLEVDGMPWMVMEFIEGHSLHDELEEHAENGRLPWRRAAEIGAAVAQALEHVHAREVVHRDLKPENVLLGPGSRVVLTDFGIARLLDNTVTRLTQPGTVLGSLHFMAPEQAAGAPADTAMDIWALGATLYATVEGRLPFPVQEEEALKHAIMHAPVDPPLHAGLLAGLLEQLLSKRPQDRPSAAAAARALAAAAAEGAAEPKPAPRRPLAGRPTRVDPAPVPIPTAVVRPAPPFGGHVPTARPPDFHTRRTETARVAQPVRGLEPAGGRPPAPFGTDERATRSSADQAAAVLRQPRPSRRLLLAGGGLAAAGAIGAAAYGTRHLLSGHAHNTGLAVSPDGTLVATADSAGKVRLENTTDPTDVVTLHAGSPAVDVAFFNPSTVLVATRNGRIRAYETLRPIRGFDWDIHVPAVTCLAVDRIEHRVVAGHSDGTVTILNSTMRTVLQVLRPEGASTAHPILRTAVSPDGNWLAASTGQSSVALWRTDSWAAAPSLRTTHTGDRVTALTFSPDSTTLAAGGSSTRAYIWRLSTGKAAAVFEISRPDVGAGLSDLAFSPDGRALATCSDTRFGDGSDPVSLRANPLRPSAITDHGISGELFVAVRFLSAARVVGMSRHGDPQPAPVSA
ncbi:protein kinase domain-containing protein [Streptomyces sp. NBC_01477]|uniref:protein kinase domain-containing protein n=1 Tax=Streptomyces sp. NBC_01477 TaxID=2976015 RepID=UPI002E36501C|nr:protein kinase [Streptomyces sp. NBC_01477]